jgi:hypothetical protein
MFLIFVIPAKAGIYIILTILLWGPAKAGIYMGYTLNIKKRLKIL